LILEVLVQIPASPPKRPQIKGLRVFSCFWAKIKNRPNPALFCVLFLTIKLASLRYRQRPVHPSDPGGRMLLAYHKSLCKEATEKHESKKEHEKALPKQCKITENNFMQSLL